MTGRPFMALAWGALACASVLPAQAQYRGGRPETLQPMPRTTASATNAATVTSFRTAYEKAARPRIAVFWNRDLDDRLTTDYDQILQASRDTSRVAAVAVDPHAGAVVAAEQSSEVTTLRAGERPIAQQAARPGLAERTDWPVAAAFNGQLQSAGVRLVDRALAMRALAAASSLDARRDVQTMELKALQDKADLLVEILQTPDPNAPLGVLFRVDVKWIATGEVLVSVATDGTPARTGPGRFVAGANGFEREAPRAPGADDVGRVLATVTMNALAGRLPSR